MSVDDVARVRVGQWRATEGVYDAWTGISGDYAVGPDGVLSLPIAGSLQVAGKTPAEVAEIVSQRLQVEIGLHGAPAVSIEIASYGPIYVTGSVAQPGEYEFRPSMTVRQAIAVAGGYARPYLTQQTSEKEILSAHGKMRQLLYTQGLVLLRIARLEAEIEGAENLEMPENLLRLRQLETDGEVQEQLFEANEQALRMKLQSVDELIELLENQMLKLQSQLELIQAEIERAEKDLANKRTLIERGLAVASSESQVARTVADLRMREIELTVEAMKVEQNLNAARRESQDIQNERNIQLLTDLEAARSKVKELEIDINTQTALFTEAIASGASTPVLPASELYKISIIRPLSAGYEPEVIVAGPLTALQPRDTVVVDVAPLPSEAGVGQ